MTIDTHFAIAERVEEEVLAEEIEIVNKNAVVSGLLLSIGGLLAILNEQRQVVALNDSFLKVLGIDDPLKALGLRPGEAMQCIHAHDHPAGCGTSRYCSTCGAAIAIVSSLGQDKPVERVCALTANQGDNLVDLALLVRYHPIRIDQKRFLLLFIQDISQQQHRAALERTFFHDINNLLGMLLGASELLMADNPSGIARSIHQASMRLVKEVAIQRCLLQSESSAYQPTWQEFPIEQIIEELESFFTNYPVAQGKDIVFPESSPTLFVRTDISLLLRVLCNMVLNALEATLEGGVVKVWLEHENQMLSFCVWNALEIPGDVVGRIFQRNFSTKQQDGRGIGTFSMKLLGEKILGGRVDFTTSGEDGTVFVFSLPL